MEFYQNLRLNREGLAVAQFLDVRGFFINADMVCHPLERRRRLLQLFEHQARGAPVISEAQPGHFTRPVAAWLLVYVVVAALVRGGGGDYQSVAESGKVLKENFRKLFRDMLRYLKAQAHIKCAPVVLKRQGEVPNYYFYGEGMLLRGDYAVYRQNSHALFFKALPGLPWVAV